MRSPKIGTTTRSLRPAMPSAAVAASAITSGGINARSVSAPRLLLWCNDSMQAGAHGVARLTGMSLQLASHANCGNSMPRWGTGAPTERSQRCDTANKMK